MPLATMQMPKIQDDIVVFAGGLDLKTPNLKLKPGHVRDAQNWQCVVNQEGGGYQRVGGYERFADSSPPSSATFSILKFTSWVDQPLTWNYVSHPPSGGQINYPASWDAAVLQGQTSGALAFPLWYVDSTITSDYAGEIYVVITATFGTFQIGETIVIPGSDIAGNLTGVIATAGVLTDTNLTTPLTARRSAQYTALAANRYRAFIGKPAGSGALLGVVSAVFNGVRKVYAFRNATDGLTAKLYVATQIGTSWQFAGVQPSAWNEVVLDYEVRFTGGGAGTPVDGNHLVQGSADWPIQRVVLESGSWLAGTANGRFIIRIPNPFFNFVAGAATAGGVHVVLAGIQTQIVLQPNGRYQFDLYNFAGQLTTRRIYGADGVNRGFEFDGDTFVPIETKAAQDTPKFVRGHHLHLLFGLGSSIVGSGPGTPYIFDAVTGGAFEVATGDEIAGMLVQPGNQDTAALGVFGRDSTGVLYGTSAADFKYVALPSMTGSLPYMQANLDQSYTFDDRGVGSLAAANRFGNFTTATLTANIDDFLNQRKQIAIGCCVSKDRSQFRLFFSDGSALYVSIVNGKMIGAMPMAFTHPFSCVWNAEDSSGNEETFAGGQDGTVYQLDRGSSFDGEAINHYFYLNVNFMKAPRIKKQFRRGSLEVQSSYYAEFSVGYRLSYGSSLIFQPDSNVYASDFSASANWDSFVWDNFVWDGVTLSPTEVDIKGKSEAVQMIVSGSADFVYPFTLSSLVTHYNLTRRTRG